MLRTAVSACVALVVLGMPALAQDRAAYDEMVKTHAKANDVPEALVHRVIKRESGYRPHLVSRGNIGLMQIKLNTARGLGYTGDAEGLRDANTNMTWAVKYLAGAYKVAHGDHDRAVRYYASGYHHEAKRQKLAQAIVSRTSRVKEALALAPRPKLKELRGSFSAPPRTDELTSASAEK